MIARKHAQVREAYLKQIEKFKMVQQSIQYIKIKSESQKSAMFNSEAGDSQQNFSLQKLSNIQGL